MSEEQNEFYKKMQKLVWRIFAGLSLVVILAVVPFYFNMKNVTKQNQCDIKKKVNMELYQVDIGYIKTTLKEIKNKN
jgi:heme/copper-type cytochrome/quinol oxidase subunit 4